MNGHSAKDKLRKLKVTYILFWVDTVHFLYNFHIVLFDYLTSYPPPKKNGYAARDLAYEKRPMPLS